MIDQYIEQLSSSDSNLRRQAIIALGKSGDKNVLPALLNVYKNDPDPQLRELALKAGRYVKSVVSPNTNSNSMFVVPKRDPDSPIPPVSTSNSMFVTPPRTADQPAPNNDNSDLSAYTFNKVQPETVPLPQSVSPFKTSYYDDEAEPVAPAPVAPITPIAPPAPPPMPSKEITYRERNLAKGRVDQAMSYRMQNNIPKAQAELAEAFRLNPDLVNDNLAANLATTLTGASSAEDAVVELNELVQKAKSNRSSGRMPVPAKKSSGQIPVPGVEQPEVAVPVQTSNASPLELLLQVVLVFGIEVVFMFLLIGFVGRVIATVPVTPQNTKTIAYISNLTGTGSISAALEYGLIITVITLFTDCIFFGVGTMLGGVGDLAHVLRGLLWVHIVSTIVSVVLAGIEVFTYSPGAAVAGSSPSTLTGIAQLISSLLGLVSFIALVIVLARTHEYSILRSLVTLIISFVAEACIIFGLVALLLRSVPQP